MTSSTSLNCWSRRATEVILPFVTPDEKGALLPILKFSSNLPDSLYKNVNLYEEWAMSWEDWYKKSSLLLLLTSLATTVSSILPR
ncbi:MULTISPECIES: hypothetical protein [unclassified Microbulbifer]|uniref:hypothetical protein n=1 Tax=unclassified Microbulbifer TaxID=2619833 RepID=UPI0027E59A2D|nr:MULTISPECIES: hypothetical protein [unclassified Microbulbifer]